MGELALQFPHLVAFNIDDMTNHITSGEINPQVIARITSQMRSRAPWLALATANYYSYQGEFTYSQKLFPDLPLVIDSPKFAFRNDKQGTGPCLPAKCVFGPLCGHYPNHMPRPGGCNHSAHKSCLAGSCADNTVFNIAGEIADLAAALPAGRALSVSVYSTQHSSLGETTPEYLASILPLIAAQPRVSGIFIYTMHIAHNCSSHPPPLFGGSKGCIVASFFGEAANKPAAELAPLAIPSSTSFDTLLEASADLSITHNWTALAVGKVCVPYTTWQHRSGSESILVVVSSDQQLCLLTGQVPRPIWCGRIRPHGTSLMPLHSWAAVQTVDLDNDGWDEVVLLRGGPTPVSDHQYDLVVVRFERSGCGLHSVRQFRIDLPNEVDSSTSRTSLGDFTAMAALSTGFGDAKSNAAEVIIAQRDHPAGAWLQLRWMASSPTDDSMSTGGFVVQGGWFGPPRSHWASLTASTALRTSARFHCNVALAAGPSGIVLLAPCLANGSSYGIVAAIKARANETWTALSAARQQDVVVARSQQGFMHQIVMKGESLVLAPLSGADPHRRWMGLALDHWLGGDELQLMGMREVLPLPPPPPGVSGTESTRVSLLVYGAPATRQNRTQALTWSILQTEAESTKSLDGGLANVSLPLDLPRMKKLLLTTSTNSYRAVVCPKDYTAPIARDYDTFVRLLDATANFEVDGRQFRMWMQVLPPTEGHDCLPPRDSPLTPFNESEIFAKRRELGRGLGTYADLEAWAEVAGRLSSVYPHLVAFVGDDFSDNIAKGNYNGSTIAAVTNRLRAHSQTINFVPVIYYGFERWSNASRLTSSWGLFPDLPLLADAVLFPFMNEREGAGPCANCPNCSARGPRDPKCASCTPGCTGCGDCANCTKRCPWPPHKEISGGCLAGACADSTYQNVGAELTDMQRPMPGARSVHLCIYATGHSNFGRPTPWYVDQLVPTVLRQPGIGGVQMRPMQAPTVRGQCNARNSSLDLGCITQRQFAKAAAGPPPPN